MKKYKRLSILILVILSVVVTWYIEKGIPEVSIEVRDSVEAELTQNPVFPVTPVWWEKGHLLGVGVIPDGKNRDADARSVCQILNKHGVKPAEVHVFDVLQIQNDDNWEQIGGAVCSR